MVNQNPVRPNMPAEANGAPVYIDFGQAEMPAQVEQRAVNPPRSFIGRLVDKVTQSRTYRSAAAYIDRTTRPIREWAIDYVGALKILGQETWKGASNGALAGLGAGCVATIFCPILIEAAFTVSITAGVTAGAIFGYLSGAMKASDFYHQARQARRAAAARPMPQPQLNAAAA